MKSVNLDPRSLVANPWNSNRVAPENEAKLDASLKRLGMFKPVVVRTLPSGSLQILGGEHRCQSAIRLGMTEIPVLNLGLVDDIRAKEISLIDNGRYGNDDGTALADVLKSLKLDNDELSSFMPFSGAELAAIFTAVEIDVDSIGFDDKDELPPAEGSKPPPSHQIMRFKVPIGDAEAIQRLIEKTIRDQGFKDSDSLTNAGDALVHLCRQVNE